MLNVQCFCFFSAPLRLCGEKFHPRTDPSKLKLTSRADFKNTLSPNVYSRSAALFILIFANTIGRTVRVTNQTTVLRYLSNEELCKQSSGRENPAGAGSLRTVLR
jgi:hypothetical protein